MSVVRHWNPFTCQNDIKVSGKVNAWQRLRRCRLSFLCTIMRPFRLDSESYHLSNFIYDISHKSIFFLVRGEGGGVRIVSKRLLFYILSFSLNDQLKIELFINTTEYQIHVLMKNNGCYTKPWQFSSCKYNVDHRKHNVAMRLLLSEV